MSVKQVASFKRGRSVRAIMVTLSTDRRVIITHNEKGSDLDTEAKMQAELDRRLRGEAEIFIHFNRDGSVALATNKVPGVWPEDAPVVEF